jgi:amidase
MSGDEDLCYHTAFEAIAQFTAKTLSPAELMRAVIARPEAVNPALNAVTATHYDHGLQQARVAEAVYMRADGNARPLEGVTIAIKDFHPVENQVTTFDHSGASLGLRYLRLFAAGTSLA